MGKIDLKKVEAENLVGILKEEKLVEQNRKGLKRLFRKIKDFFVVSHQFRDNGIDYPETVKRPKIVVYTCVTGGYDKIIEPNFDFDNIDYILFSDKNVKVEKWDVRQIPKGCKMSNNVMTNRFIKMNPHLLFSGSKYDYSIYVDGNIKIVSDLTPMTTNLGKLGLAFHRHALRDDISKEVKSCIWQKKGNRKALLKQAKEYKKDGFPKDFGMLECNVIVADLKSHNSEAIMNNWWYEFNESGSMRDQIALPYVIWKMGYKIEDLGNLGYNIYRNPKFRKMGHKR